MVRCSPTRSRWIVHEVQIRFGAPPDGWRRGRGYDAGVRHPRPSPDGPESLRRSAPTRRTASWRHRRMAARKTIGILPRDVLDHPRGEIRWLGGLDPARDLLCLWNLF